MPNHVVTSKWSGLIALSVATLLLFACGASVPSVTDTDIARAEDRWPDLDPGDLERGRTLYVGRCGSCHRLERPSSRAPEHWPRKIDAMATRAGLSREAQELITRYVVTISERAVLSRNESASGTETVPQP